MTNPVATLFDSIAADYDQSGVAFFGPIADRLVTALDPRPGERCLDVGCGRGAVAARLVERVGPDGEVLGVDLAPGMVEQAIRAVPAARFEVGDAMAPGAEDAGWDLVASSLVLFFLPDPVAALSAWTRRLRPGGRLGITTFGAQDDVWRAIDEVLRPWLPEADPRSNTMMQRFGSDQGVDDMLREAGLADVISTRSPLPVVFADADQWHRFSMSTGQRAAWGRVPEEERPGVRARCVAVLEQARRPGGDYEVAQDVRVTTGRRPG